MLCWRRLSFIEEDQWRCIPVFEITFYQYVKKSRFINGGFDWVNGLHFPKRSVIKNRPDEPGRLVIRLLFIPKVLSI